MYFLSELRADLCANPGLKSAPGVETAGALSTFLSLTRP